MNANVSLMQINDWVFRVRTPEGDGPFPVTIMLHGLTGDENSMWVFSSRLPERTLLIAPRGLYPSPSGGYSWVSTATQTRQDVNEYFQAIEQLSGALIPANFPQADFTKLNFVGFSQGAALALMFLLMAPGRVNLAAALSGYLPAGAAAFTGSNTLAGKHVFLAHGTKDNQIPVEMARQAVDLLEGAGARVIYCEDEIGHKLSASCFKGLEAFFEAI